MSAKDNKTSKTARVMNLLSKKTDVPPTEETADSVPAASSAPIPPVISSMGPDAAVAGQIKDALEDALEAELAPKPDPAEELQKKPILFDIELPEDPPAQEEVPAEAAPEAAAEAPAQEESPEVEAAAKAPVQEAAPEEAVPEEAASKPEAQVAAETPAAAEEPEEAEPAPLAEAAAEAEESAQAAPTEEVKNWHGLPSASSLGYINVMQVLVEEKAPKYVQMFGLCQCKRCLEDVKALTLNSLPPKYVVLEQGDMIPRLTLYEGKFSSDITAQLLHACKIVMETPHHNR